MATSELSTLSRAQIRQQPQTAQPESPAPHPQALEIILYFYKKKKCYFSSLSRISVRSHAAETADAVASALSADGADHAFVMVPLVPALGAHAFGLLLIPLAFTLLFALFSCSFHCNNRRS